MSAPPRTLPVAERQAVLAVLHEPRFVDLAPAEVYATLIEEDRYLCSVRTMHRILAENHESGERRDQIRHAKYAAPELLATGPNQLWSWDITKLRSSVRGVYYDLYVIIDIYSRYVVGWTVAAREDADIAKALIASAAQIHGAPDSLHADRGTSMRSKSVAELLVDLEVTKSHSRPYVSDDNPFSEAQFKTFKYRPDFPPRFDYIEDARAHCQQFFPWYNDSHRHSGIGYMTPAAVHHGQAQDLFEQRAKTLDAAFAAHPKRFKRNCPQPPKLPVAAWINPPKKESDLSRKSTDCTLN